MQTQQYPLYLANEPVQTGNSIAVYDKFSAEHYCSVSSAGSQEIEAALVASERARAEMRALPPYRRQEILQHCADRFSERSEELALGLCREAGKPIKDSRGEVVRLIDTFRIAAEEAVRINGEVLNLEISARAQGYRGMDRRVAVGTCACISPFNFPLNLVAHKIAPAIAAGCPFILKPASRTPVGALLIAEVLAECELPKGAFSILPCGRETAEPLITDDRVQLLSFTGSPEAGWELKRRAGKKKVTLELGGNAACVVEPGYDISFVVDRLITGAFYQSGQSCISVQRILVHEQLYDEVKAALIAKTKSLVIGDPRDEETFIGPMISQEAAARVQKWIAEAVANGAEVLCGGGCKGVMHEPTLLEGVARSERIYKDEVFGPVAMLNAYSDFKEAIEEVNDSRYGLQAGVFTKNIDHILLAWDELEVGGVIIGDVPSWRVDHMPYGGVKDSGFGREGIRYAIEDMTEPRLLVIRS